MSTRRPNRTYSKTSKSQNPLMKTTNPHMKTHLSALDGHRRQKPHCHRRAAAAELRCPELVGGGFQPLKTEVSTRKSSGEGNGWNFIRCPEVTGALNFHHWRELQRAAGIQKSFRLQRIFFFEKKKKNRDFWLWWRRNAEGGVFIGGFWAPRGNHWGPLPCLIVKWKLYNLK